jgi:uncharacterized protein (DUF1810 family)
MSEDRYNLQRFLEAQAAVFDRVLAELGEGRKRSHWMWFVFPQIAGLGSSGTAQHFAISGLDEAAAYLAHPILGARLSQCTQLVNQISTATIEQIFGYPDHLKFRSSMTLFAKAAPSDPIFRAALDRYFDGQPDDATLALL